ncbi:sugar nucleotidyltransferase [Candidatus Thiomargarita nelsonii]|uniref:Sugar nucleotidyltransferase n=1 Tax=Candidatus Thiomargarita nelsonii TaxID=1003181 RepID=A0A4E0QW11_9GAMM|nr:sugar nucleotidyltransferase [Candidatus Thiomargarita nelsonii]
MANPVTTAVILAAGLGSRLKALGTDKPKGFLKLGEKSIIEESIERLHNSGICNIIIVTGHQAGSYHQLQSAYPQLIKTVHNPLFAESGSMYSLSLVRERVQEDFLLLESDLIYEQRALSVCQTYPQDNVVLLSGETQAGDEVFVETDSQNRLKAMSKDRHFLGDNIAGELVGISKISMPLFQVMLDAADRRFLKTLQVDYETDGLVEAAKTYPVYCQVVDDLIWTEIDDENHLERAVALIYPALCHKKLRERSFL